MDRRPIVEVKDLWFSLNGHTILKEVNLTIHRGDFLALIGPNGGGKTTLLKLVLGLLKPDRGSIRVFGRPPREVSHRIGYVAQHVHSHKDFPISVMDVVLMGRLQRGMRRSAYAEADRANAREVLERLEMWEHRHHRIGELSGGQQQRVFVARALISEPELLLLDEPTASVDSQGQSDLYAFLEEINRAVTILVVSHDLQVMARCFKSVACVNQRLFFHDGAEIPEGMLDMAYLCPVDVIAHGVPHRVLPEHTRKEDA